MPARISEMPAAIAQRSDLVPTVRLGNPNQNQRVDAGQFLEGSTRATWGGTATGTANDILLSPSLPWTSYDPGARIRFIVGPNSNTAAVTLTVSNLGARSLLRASGGPLVAGDLTPGELHEAAFDGAAFRLLPRPDDMLHLRDFGAIGNGVADDTAAVNAWWAAINSTRKVGIIGPGTFRCNSPILWNLTPNNGVVVLGAGNGASVIDVRDAPASLDGNAQFLLQRSAGPAFYGEFAGFSILGNNTTGPTAKFGRGSLADEFNGVIFRDIEVKNVANAAGAIALELNGHFNCDFQTLTTNTGGTRVAGTSLRIGRASFCRFFGSFSGANIGLLVDGTFTFGNFFGGINIEEVNIGVRFAGSSNNRNVFAAGTFVANTCLDFQAGSGGDNMMLSPNLSFYGGGSFGTNFNGVVILGNAATPAGTLLAGGLRLPQPSGDAAVTLEAAPSFSAVFGLRRAALDAWRFGLNTANSLFFNRHNPATGAFIEEVARFDATSGDFLAQRAQVISRLIVPNYTVAGLPSAAPAAQVAYVSNESGGAVLAFSDGTNWRRVTDRAIVS